MEVKIRVKLNQLLKQRDISQTELKNMIDDYYQSIGIDKKIRAASISELCNNQRTTLNKELMESIVAVLNINEPNDFFEFIIHKQQKDRQSQ